MTPSFSPDILTHVLDALSVRVFWKDQDSRFLGCNKAFAEDAGFSGPEAFVGHSDYFFYPPDQASAFRDDDSLVMYTGQPKLRIVEKLTKPGGEVRWLETNKWPLRNAEGQIVGVVGMYRDITEEQARGIEERKARRPVASVAA